MAEEVTLSTMGTVVFSDLKFYATSAKRKENHDLAAIKPPKVQMKSNKYFNRQSRETICL